MTDENCIFPIQSENINIQSTRKPLQVFCNMPAEMPYHSIHFVGYENKEGKTHVQKDVSIRPSTGAKPLYTLIAAVPIHLIVVVAIVLLNLYVAASVSSQIPPFILSKHSPDAATSIYGEADLIAPHRLPFCNRAFVR